MTRGGPFSWRTGAGWLVLVGGGPRASVDWAQIDAAVLAWAIPGRPCAIVVTDPETALEAEDTLDCWAELGGPSGYILDLFTSSDAHLAETADLLSEAGLVLLSDGRSAPDIAHVLSGSPALEAAGFAFEDGAPIVAVGSAAVALGAWVESPALPGGGEPGLAWASNVVVAPNFTGAENAEWLGQALAAHGDCLGLGIPEGSALALGPGGRLVSLGTPQVTVILGHGLTP